MKHIIFCLSVLALLLSSCANWRETRENKRHKLDLENVGEITKAYDEFGGVDSSKLILIQQKSLEVMDEIVEFKTKDTITTQIIEKISEDASRSATQEIEDILYEKISDVKEEKQTLSRERFALNNELESSQKYFTVENIESRKKEIIDEELERFKKQFGVVKLSQEMVQEISVRAKTVLEEEMLSEQEKLLKIQNKLTVIRYRENMLIYELKFLESNPELAKILWKISRHAYFETGESKLPENSVVEIEKDCRIYIDSIVARVNDIRVLGEELNLKQHFVLRIFIDGYADSEKYGGMSKIKSDEKNKILSEQRANEIKQIVSKAFNERKDVLEEIGFDLSKIEYNVKWYGNERPNINVDFEKEGNPDQKRRIVIVQGLFFPIE